MTARPNIRTKSPAVTALDKIEIGTNLIAAIATWAHTDAYRGIGSVVFRDGAIIATDGHRLVHVPHPTIADEFGITRAHLIAAVAAQDAMTRDGTDPQIGHDLVETPAGEQILADGPHGIRTIEIRLKRPDVEIKIGAINLVVPVTDSSQFPTSKAVESVLNQGDRKSTPDCYLLDARYLAAIVDVNNASAGFGKGIRVTHWDSLDANGVRGPVVLQNASGIRFAIMPHREDWTAS